MTLDDFEKTPCEIEPGQGAHVPYEIFTVLWPPGEVDDHACRAARAFAIRAALRLITGRMTGQCGSTKNPEVTAKYRKKNDAHALSSDVWSDCTGRQR